MQNTNLVLAVGLLGLVTGCDRVEQTAKDLLGVREDDHVDLDGPEPMILPDFQRDLGSAPPPDDTQRIPEQPLEKALAKYPFLAKGAPNLGFKLTALDELFALRVRVEVPSWGSENSNDPSAVLDGDLDTVWTCTPQDLQSCTLGFHFPRGGTVKAVKVFAAGTTDRENTRYPRPKKIRLHTAKGFAEANIPDSSESVFVVLGREVETPNLSVEFIDFWNGEADELRVGEVEIFGSEGAHRPPLQVDPRRAFVTWEERSWRKKGAEHRPSTSFVRTVDSDGVLRTLALGSALRGRGPDRIILLERLQDGTCTRVEGTVHLLDQQNRVVAPLGELGGIGGDMFRHEKGLGVALGYTDEFSTTLAGVVVDRDRGYVVKRTPLREDKRKKDTFGDWRFEPLIIPREGTPLGASTPGCHTASSEEIEDLRDAVEAEEPGRRRRKDALSSDDGWTICEAGDVRGFFSDEGGCGDAWHFYAVASDGSLARRVSEKHPGSKIKLRRLAEDELLVEATGMDDSGTVARLSEDGLSVLTDRGAFAVPPPGDCRKECGDGFVNPHAPDW